MKRTSLLVLSIVSLSPLGACISSNNPVVLDFDGGAFEYDGGSGFDGSIPDAASIDSTVADTGAADDVTVPARDTSPPSDDGGTEANAPDAQREDATTLPVDAAAADAGTPDATQGGEPDVVVVIVDAAPIVDAGAPDAYDSGIWCVTHVLGDYYSRLDGTLVYEPLQTVVTGLPPATTVKDLAQQVDHSCALVSDGTVWCWPSTTAGGNGNGDLGNGTIGGSTTPIAATQVQIQSPDAGPVNYLTNVVALESASMTTYDHTTCAIRSDKSVWCWGLSEEGGSSDFGLFYGATGSIANQPYAIPLALSAPDAGSYPPILADAVSVGIDDLCYLLAGQVYCMGSNVSGNLANGDTNFGYRPYPAAIINANGLTPTVTAITSGYRLNCALASGNVWCWGTNSQQQVGNPAAPTSFCNLNYCEPLPTPVQISLPDGGINPDDAGIDAFPLTGVTELRAAYLGACALASGQLYCWGTGVKEATPYTSSFVPYTGITSFTFSGAQEDFPVGLRYLSPIGLVEGQQVVTPVCP